MPEIFNFLENPFLVVLRESLKSLPGIDRIDLLFYNSESAQTELHSIIRDSDQLQAIRYPLDEKSKEILNTFRRRQLSLSWLNSNSIPFYNQNETTIKQNLFSEIDSHVLCLALPNNSDFSKDLYLFYFKKNTSDFGLILTDTVLSTSNKAIISHLIGNIIKVQLDSVRQNQSALRFINSQNREIIDSKNNIQVKNQELRLLLKTNIIQLTEYLINEISENAQDVFYLSEDAKEKISAFKGSILEFKNMLGQAMVYAKALNYGSQNDECILKADYLNFEIVNENKAERSTNPNNSIVYENHKHFKTFEFLNEIEEAAKIVIEEGWKLTSSNVGHKFEKPVTAAAISDKLKHHSEKIIRLFEQYPAKWPLIRKRFKPIQNVIIKAEYQQFDKATG